MTPTLLFATRFTTDDVRAAGSTRAAIRAWLEAGLVRRVARGVYEPASLVHDAHLPRAQVRHAVERGDVLHPSLVAASHHQLWTPPRIPSQLLSADGRRVVPEEFTFELAGRRMQSAAWTATQLARWQSLHGALISLDSALRIGVTRPELLDAAARMRGWPGSALLRRAIALADARSESALESWIRGLIITQKLPLPELQYEITVAGYRYRCDFVYPMQRVICEADGEQKLGETIDERKRRDYEWHRRQGRLQKAGFIVVRWGWKEVQSDHGAWAQSLRSALAGR